MKIHSLASPTPARPTHAAHGNWSRWLQFLVLPLAFAGGAQAASFTWDGNGSTAPNPDGGTGTWNTDSTANWWNGTTNVVWPATSSGNDDAVFANTADTVTISGGVIANDLTFNTTGYAITGSTLTLDGTTPTITTGTGISATIGSLIQGTVGLKKSGAGTLTLSGLSTTAANNYSGNTIIDGGTLAITNDAALSNNLVFGTAAGSTVGSLDLSSASATFATLRVQTVSTSYNTISIGSGRTLTTTGNVAINYGLASPASGDTRLQVSGLGEWKVDSSGGSIQVGGGGNGGRTRGILDMSGLSTFTASLGTTGDVRVGYDSITTAGYANTLTLATTSTITAGRLAVGRSNDSGAKTLNLGNGTQTLNVNNLTVGGDELGTYAANSASTFKFNTGTGSVTIRGATGGASAADLYIGYNSSSLGSSLTHTFNVSGHTADMVFDDMIIGRRNSNSTNGQTVNFTFDTGSMTVANQAVLAESPNQNQNTVNMTLGGGSVGNGSATFTSGIMLGRTTASSGAVTANLTINGNTGYTFGVTSGTITMGQRTGGTGTITSTLNLNGGTLTMTGNIQAGTGTATRTLTLGGGTLDMGGYSIGGATAITTNFQSGTLKNVAQINAGAGLTKSTAGTLILEGTNTYTGNTNVSDGKLIINGSTSTSSAVTVNTAGTLGGTGTVGGSVTLDDGAFLSPGASIESLATGSNTWNGGSTFVFEFSTDGSTGTAGTDWDLLAITGNLDLAGASVLNPIHFDLITMANAATAGPLGTWNPNANATWSGFVTTTTGIAGFDATSFQIDTTGFGNTINGTFSIAQSGNNLDLIYTTVPEPSAALLGGIGLLMLPRRRR